MSVIKSPSLRPGGIFLQNRNQVTGFGVAFGDHNRKDPFPRHYTVPGLLPDRAVRVTFLADLRYFTKRRPDPKPAANGKLPQRDSFTPDVLGKSSRPQRNFRVLLHLVHAFLPQQADLPVPVSCVGVAVNSVCRAQVHRLHGMLLFSLSFADTNSPDYCAVFHLLFSNDQIPIPDQISS